jgi:uncharacterized membrane protein
MLHMAWRVWAPQYKTISRYWLALFLGLAALLRLHTDTVENLLALMVPPPLPGKLCVYASGIVEAVCAILLLLPRYATRGAYLTLGLLLAVYPSNMYHAFSKTAQDKIKYKPCQKELNFRLVLQLVFLYWAAWFLK